MSNVHAVKYLFSWLMQNYDNLVFRNCFLDTADDHLKKKTFSTNSVFGEAFTKFNQLPFSVSNWWVLKNVVQKGMFWESQIFYIYAIRNAVTYELQSSSHVR